MTTQYRVTLTLAKHRRISIYRTTSTRQILLNHLKQAIVNTWLYTPAIFWSDMAIFVLLFKQRGFSTSSSCRSLTVSFREICLRQVGHMLLLQVREWLILETFACHWWPNTANEHSIQAVSIAAVSRTCKQVTRDWVNSYYPWAQLLIWMALKDNNDWQFIPSWASSKSHSHVIANSNQSCLCFMLHMNHCLRMPCFATFGIFTNH